MNWDCWQSSTSMTAACKHWAWKQIQQIGFETCRDYILKRSFACLDYWKQKWLDWIQGWLIACQIEKIISNIGEKMARIRYTPENRIYICIYRYMSQDIADSCVESNNWPHMTIVICVDSQQIPKQSRITLKHKLIICHANHKHLLALHIFKIISKHKENFGYAEWLSICQQFKKGKSRYGSMIFDNASKPIESAFVCRLISQYGRKANEYAPLNDR